MYLYGDKTIKVDRDSVEVLPRRVPPPNIGDVGFDPSPNLATDRTICELSLPSERDTWAVDLCPQLQCHVESGSADLQPGGLVRGGGCRHIHPMCALLDLCVTRTHQVMISSLAQGRHEK